MRQNLVCNTYKFHWKTLRSDAEKFVARCLSRAQTRGNTPTAPILEYSLPDEPFHTIGINLLQFLRSHKGSSNVLVYVNQFCRFVIVVPLPNKSAVTIAHTIVSILICPYHTPRVLHSDNGIEFSKQVLASICNQFNIQRVFIAVHHPLGNGILETTNKNNLGVLRHFAGKFHEY